MKKFVAKQVDPCFQNSDFDAELFEEGNIYDNLLITGNKDYDTLGTPLREELMGWEENLDEIDNAAQKGDIKQLKEFFPHGSDRLGDYELALDTGEPVHVLKAVTGKDYKEWSLNGCVQAEWNYLYTPDTDEWTNEKVEDFAARYWNTGDEWEIAVSPELVGEDSDSGILTVDTYTTGFRDVDIKADIADALYRAGVDQDLASPDNVVLQRCTGYERVPVYEDVDVPKSEEELKAEFVEKLGQLFADYGVSQVSSLEYDPKNEIVTIHDGDGSYKVSVAADSTFATAYDVIRAMWKH